MAEYRISDRADADLLDIYVFGVRTFGRSQAVAYQLSFRECFGTLAEHPRMGRSADAIGRGIRRHEHGSHVVLYREEGYGVLIVAIVHGRSMRGLRA